MSFWNYDTYFGYEMQQFLEKLILSSIIKLGNQ